MENTDAFHVLAVAWRSRGASEVTAHYVHSVLESDTLVVCESCGPVLVAECQPVTSLRLATEAELQALLISTRRNLARALAAINILPLISRGEKILVISPGGAFSDTR